MHADRAIWKAVTNHVERNGDSFERHPQVIVCSIFFLGFPVESIISKNFSLYAWPSDHATKDIIAPATFPDSPLSLLLL